MSAGIPDRLVAALADRYRIDRALGSGGMATVYLAEDLKHDRKVAIKVLKPELAAVLGAERFVVEIKTTAALSHPHILPLFDSGEAGGFLYYVMPYIEGETIRDRLNRDTQLSIEESVRITREIADALDYAHRHGVIHRDIKPENILLHDGRAMVMDFGIALAVSAAAGGRMTETGLSLGTPHYMSPEQATADKAITGRSDLYSLASVCYEMLAGEPPHLGNSAQQIIMKIIAEPVQLVTVHRKSVPPHVAAALAKALEKLPADRFDSAKAFGDALNDQHFTTTVVRAAGSGGASGRRGIGVLAGLAVGVALGVLATQLLRPESRARGEVSRGQLTFSGLANRPAISPDGRRIAYVVDPCTAADTACTVSLEVLELGATKAQVLIPAARNLDVPRWSHDGETVVIGATLTPGRPGVFAVPRLNATPRLIYDGTGIYDTHPSADSAVIVTEAGDAMVIVGLSDATVRDRVPVSVQLLTAIAWSPSGRLFAVYDEGGLRVLGRDGKERDRVATTATRQTLRWSVSGDALIYFNAGRAREDELVRRSVSGDGALSEREDVIMPRTPTLYNGEFDLARETGAIAFKTGEARTDIWSIALDRRPITATQETRGTTWYGNPASSPDGRVLYYFRGDAVGDNVYRLDRVTGVEEALTAEAGPGSNQMMISPDGNRLAFSRERASGLTMQDLDIPSRRVRSASGSSTGTYVPVTPQGVLAVGERQQLVVFDSLGGTPRLLTNPDSLAVMTIAVTPDGRTALFVAEQLPLRDAGFTAVLGSVPIAGGAVTQLATWSENWRGQRRRVPSVSLNLDGSVFVSRWLPGEALPSLWQTSLRGGPLTRAATVPVPCTPWGLMVGWNGRTATCIVFDARADIWLVDLGAATR